MLRADDPAWAVINAGEAWQTAVARSLENKRAYTRTAEGRSARQD